MIKREVSIFLVVGSLTVLIDFLCYRTLLWFHLVDRDLAKGIGFLSGTLFAYFANRFWTFGHQPAPHGSVWRFMLVYAVNLGINIMVNASLLAWFGKIFPQLWAILSVNEFYALTIKPHLVPIQAVLDKLSINEFALQLAFLIATITSATLNFVGMKFFVFKTRALTLS